VHQGSTDEVGKDFWLKFAGAVSLLLSLSGWLYFYLAAKEVALTGGCLLYTSDRWPLWLPRLRRPANSLTSHI